MKAIRMFFRSVLFFLISFSCFENISFAAADSRDVAHLFFRGAGHNVLDFIDVYRRTGDVGIRFASQEQEAAYDAVAHFNLTAPSDEDLIASDEVSLVSTSHPVEQGFNDNSEDSHTFFNMDVFSYPSLTVSQVEIRVLGLSQTRAYFYTESLERGDRIVVKILEDNDGNTDEMPRREESRFVFSSVNDRPILEFTIYNYGVKLKSVEPTYGLTRK